MVVGLSRSELLQTSQCSGDRTPAYPSLGNYGRISACITRYLLELSQVVINTVSTLSTGTDGNIQLEA